MWMAAQLTNRAKVAIRSRLKMSNWKTRLPGHSPPWSETGSDHLFPHQDEDWEELQDPWDSSPSHRWHWCPGWSHDIHHHSEMGEQLCPQQLLTPCDCDTPPVQFPGYPDEARVRLDEVTQISQGCHGCGQWWRVYRRPSPHSRPVWWWRLIVDGFWTAEHHVLHDVSDVNVLSCVSILDFCSGHCPPLSAFLVDLSDVRSWSRKWRCPPC